MSGSTERDLIDALPGYEVGGVLGQGGYGVVRFGRHRRLGRPVAIKQIPSALARDPEVRARFVEEARALASFDHPHIVQLYDYVERDELCLLVMEHLPGGSVGDLAAGKGVTAETACAIALVICSGLHYAHQHRILHRDIKPENALRTANHTLKVTDFGIAKVVGGKDVFATSAGELLGTPAYMAPEQASGGDLGPAADVYATGTMLYELLSGRLPYSEEGGGLATVYRHVYEDPVDLRDVAPQVPRQLADVVMRALARELPDRYPTAEAFGVAVGSASTDCLGSGWLARSSVRLLAPGRIFDSAAARGRPRTTAAPAAVPLRRVDGGQRTGKVRVSAIKPEELVPVQRALRPPTTGRTPAVAAVLTAVTALVALAAPPLLRGDDPAAPPDGTRVQVNGTDVSAGGRARVDLLATIPVAVESTGSVPTEVRLRVSAAGVPLGEDPRAKLVQGRAELRARSLALIAGGPVDAELQLFRGEEPAPGEPYHFVLVPTASSRMLSGAVTLGLVLFLVAYAEALLRPVRRRRRYGTSALLGMSAIGAGGGVACVLVVWVLGLHPLTPSVLVLCALLGAAAGVAGACAVAAVARTRHARGPRTAQRAARA